MQRTQTMKTSEDRNVRMHFFRSNQIFIIEHSRTPTWRVFAKLKSNVIVCVEIHT